MAIRDRIIDFRRVPASSLAPHPENWRTHPPAQRAAMRAVLEEIGFAGAVLARENGDGQLQMIDGHLRQDEMGNQDVPVLVLDVTADEAQKLLATFDPLGAMAEADAERLDALLSEVGEQEAGLQALLDSLAAQHSLGPLPADADGKEFDESCADDVKMQTCPKCNHEFPI